MKKNNKNKNGNDKKQNLILVASVIVILICAFISIKTIVKNNQNKKEENNSADKDVLKDTKVGNLTITDARLEVNNDVTSFMAIVTNDTTEDYHFNTLYITFTVDGITSTIPILQDITLNPNESKPIILTLDSNVSETTKIEYIIE